MRRREFITLLGGAAATWPPVARAQVSTKRPLIAVLSAITKEGNSPLGAFEQGMRELGYVDGQNIDIEYWFAEGHLERFPVLAEELLRLSPNIIVATVTPAAVAARTLTQTIPIVCPLLADPIGFGLIATESRPGGNGTGVSFRTEGLTSKQVRACAPNDSLMLFKNRISGERCQRRHYRPSRTGSDVSEVRHQSRSCRGPSAK